VRHAQVLALQIPGVFLLLSIIFDRIALLREQQKALVVVMCRSRDLNAAHVCII
jgi:hypothetical protein